MGSFEALSAAIKAGANSVYFGVEQLNMRARAAAALTIDDIPELTDTCKLAGIKCYLTVNTILYDHDMNVMKCIVNAALKAGVNAIIATDPAVLAYAKMVNMPVHISTQANISNYESVEFFAAYADVMVLARELSLKQVEAINHEIYRNRLSGPSGNLVSTEIFAHGALCMAISGKCYLSLHSDFASANRGACLQNCRHSFLVTDKETGEQLEVDNEYIMSAKDLCTIDFIDQLIEAGVSVLKIEGRGRSADYVYTVTKCYREAIDAYYHGNYSQQLFADWRERLSTVFNLGFWDGYYLGRKMGEWNNQYGSRATKRKIYVGKGMKYFKQVGVGEFRMEAQSLAVGDEIIIIGPTTGVVQAIVDELRVDDISRDSVSKGDTFSIPLTEVIRPADRLYKLVAV